MTEKIYPDYDIIRSGKYEVDFGTFVRKQREDGIWCLIPVRQKFFYNKGIGKKKRHEGLLFMIKDFSHTCYRVLQAWTFREEIKIEEPPYLIHEEVDKNQQSEFERVNILDKYYYYLKFDTGC